MKSREVGLLASRLDFTFTVPTAVLNDLQNFDDNVNTSSYNVRHGLEPRPGIDLFFELAFKLCLVELDR